jgi:hypothetical protein
LLVSWFLALGDIVGGDVRGGREEVVDDEEEVDELDEEEEVVEVER